MRTRDTRDIWTPGIQGHRDTRDTGSDGTPGLAGHWTAGHSGTLSQIRRFLMEDKRESMANRLPIRYIKIHWGAGQ